MNPSPYLLVRSQTAALRLAPRSLPSSLGSHDLDLLSLTLAARGLPDAPLCVALYRDESVLRSCEASGIAALNLAAGRSAAAGATSRLALDDPLAYFALALAHLSHFSAGQLREELAAQCLDPAAGLCIGAIERAWSDRMGLSSATLSELGHLNTLGITPDFVLHKADPQAVGFMVDILGVLRDLLLPSCIGQRLSVLDLGAKSGAGSQLAAYLGQGASFSKIKFDVSCADLDATFATYSRTKHPLVDYLVGDAFATGRQWDVVVCSHVVEHVPDPLAFVRRLRGLAKRWVVLAFPYMEDPAALVPGHLHSLGHEFLRALSPARHLVYEGLFWSQSLCCIAVLAAEPRETESS